MTLQLTDTEQAMLAGKEGTAASMALRIVVGTAEMLGAERLVDVASAHIDGCLYHGDSGTLFAERLVTDGGAVLIPTSLNVGALDLVHAGRVRLPAHEMDMARRMMSAYVALGCRQTWTCAPYQAAHRPAVGQDVAWGESNAVVFCNSVLGARTNRYGDYLDICAAITGKAPLSGLHLQKNRAATIVIDVSSLHRRLMQEDAFYPVLGAWLGRNVGSDIAAIAGLPKTVTEDQLKSLGAASASTGAVGLFHVVGVTPEAPDLMTACQGNKPMQVIQLTPSMLEPARRALSTVEMQLGDPIDGIALGSPHFSIDECRQLLVCLSGRRSRVPFYVCTGRHVLDVLQKENLITEIEQAGITIVADTCIVVTPILPEGKGVLMTNSGKFAHYTKPNTNWDVLYGSLSDCVESAVTGHFCRDEVMWQ